MERCREQKIDFRRAEIERPLTRRGEDVHQGHDQQQERQVGLGQPAEHPPRRVVAQRRDEQRGHEHHPEEAHREDDQKRAAHSFVRHETVGASSP